MANKRRKSESTPDDAVIQARRLEALDLRKSGASYRAIGQRLGVSHEQARLDIMACLAELAERQHEDTAQYRQLELERLDRLQMALWVKAVASPPDTRAALAVLRIFERRAKLLGLDAPTHVQIDDWRSQAIADIRAGKVTYEDLVNGFDTSIAAQLFAEAGIRVSTE